MRIAKVVLEPNNESPEAIQGVLSLAKPDDRNEYLPPVRAYLCMRLTGSNDATQREWRRKGPRLWQRRARVVTSARKSSAAASERIEAEEAIRARAHARSSHS